MAKIKIYELAKELSVESKDLLRDLQKINVNAKSHMSSISEKDAEALRQEYAQRSGGPGGFVPRVKRIPKAVVEKEQAELAGENGVAAVDVPENAPAAATATSVPKAPEAKETPAVPVEENKPAAAPAEPVAVEKPAVQPETPAATAVPQATDQAVAGTVQAAATAPPVMVERRQAPPAARTQAERPQQQSQNRPQGQGGGYQGQGRPQGQGQNRPGQGRPQGQGGGYQGQGQNRPGQGRPQGQGGGYQGQGQNRPGQGRPQGQGGGYQGQGQNRPGQGRPQGQGGGYQGQGQNRPGQGRPQGQGGGYQGQNRPGQGRPQGQGARGGLNIPPPAVSTEKPSNYRPASNKKNFTKDQIFERANQHESGRGAKGSRFGKGKKDKSGKRGRQEQKVVMPPVTPKKITIGETVVLGELAKSMGKTASEIIKKLFEMGIMATINQELDAETAILLADEFGITVEVAVDKTAEILEDIDDDESEMVERPPVVTIMGHVDHGKTSLLDAIRHTNVISTEAGGITQHIGAYQVEIKGKKITFLDTPGHEAFTAMRARGAQMTDVAIIVVAADDGVMPQTIEAINHSKAAGVPIIIAINKIDKPDANPDRVKQELTEHGLVPEEWGGDTVMVPVSAKARQNLDGLLEMILLVSEVAELKANPNRQARGAVVESRLDKNRGPVVTLLVQKGTLHVGDNLLAGPVFGKVRAMTDDKGRKVKAATPSMPVEVLGFSEVPAAGEVFISAKDDKDARFVAQRQQVKRREDELRKSAKVSLDDLFKQIEQGEIKDLNLVVKADVHGSEEAVNQSLLKLNDETNEVKVNVIHSGVGGISESDVNLAAASNAIIIGFNVRPMPAAVKAAETENVDIRLYRVIYDAIEDIKQAMSGLLAPEFKEQVIGHAEVRQVFKVPKAGMVAGSYVQEGKISRHAKVRVVRDSVVVAEDEIASLRRFKDDAKEVAAGYECGIGLENFNDIKEGDIIEAFVMEEIQREL